MQIGTKVEFCDVMCILIITMLQTLYNYMPQVNVATHSNMQQRGKPGNEANMARCIFIECGNASTS